MIYREDGSEVRVGDRICSEGYYATIKFIGSVPTTNGLWLGVDWDVDDRGKHNGIKDGVHYFHTRTDTSGSFVRPNKVQTGVSCLSAVHHRYGRVDGEMAGVNEEDLFIVDENRRQIIVEIVGADKVLEQQSELSKLSKLVLREMYIYGNVADELTGSVMNVRELNLSRNLVSTWVDVANITVQLPHLTTLDVSDNRLTLPDEPQHLADSFSQLDTIFMNKLNYSWHQILRTTDMFPNLRTLHACFNRVTHLDTSTESRLVHVTLVNLEGNTISHWGDILELGHLPQLRHLILSGNQLADIHFPDGTPQIATTFFTKLCELSLNENKFSDWKCFGELNKVKSLLHLRMNKNPLNALISPPDVRSNIIARLGSLCSFNRSLIGESERRGAEYEYVKAHYTAWKDAGGDVDPSRDHTTPEFTAAHPGLPTLVRLHGEPEKGELLAATTTIRQNLISVTIRDTTKEFKKKLPVKMTIQKLATLVRKLYSNDSDDIYLSYISTEVPDREFSFDHMMRDLAFYSVENEDTIVVRWSPKCIRKVRKKVVR